MFQIGQTVYHKTSKFSGKVQECDRETTYLLQENGVEVEFPTGDLTATPPATKVDAASVMRTITMKDISPEHQKVLSIIPMRTIQAVAALWERDKSKGRFSTLNVAQKLNYIAEVTEVSYLVMRQHTGEPSHLGLLMARGLAKHTLSGKAD